MPWIVEASNGIRLPQIGWHLDAHRAVERCFVTHAHSDHVARHRHVVCTPETSRLMAARLPGRRTETTLPFGREYILEDGTRATLHPAGHILGSAQVRLENEHGVLLYTGDFKLRPGLAAERCTTPRADTLIMETTFGLPRYVLPPDEEVRASIVDFCRRTLAEGAVPVLHAYSLGKSQELLATLAGAGLPIMVHPRVWKMTRVYEEIGMTFPEYRLLDAEGAKGHVVITPPETSRSPELRSIRPQRTAVVSGWALDRGAIYRNRCDAAFPLSDHAGYDDLLLFVAQVRPRCVYTVHGFAREFACDLRARGIEAWALGRENQLEFPMEVLKPTDRGPGTETRPSGE